MALIATGITQAEWEFAKETTTAHLMLLRCLAGTGQRTIPERSCLFKEGAWRSEIERLRKLKPEGCGAQLDEGIGKWHVKNTD